jgi:hypothetical protein
MCKWKQMHTTDLLLNFAPVDERARMLLSKKLKMFLAGNLYGDTGFM